MRNLGTTALALGSGEGADSVMLPQGGRLGHAAAGGVRDVPSTPSHTDSVTLLLVACVTCHPHRLIQTYTAAG
eukprot:365474-Chlamydomonas_euryale.AAC.5